MKKGRKLLALLCAAGIGLTQCAPALAVDSGRGTASSPYAISSALDFADIAHNPSGNYILTRDIKLTGGFGDTEFSGALDGNGHRIELAGSKPLFKSVSGSVKNLSLEADISGGSGILADTLTGTVSQSDIRGQVSGSGAENLGGIAGVIDGGAVTDSVVSAYVTGSASSAGALAGTARDAKITNCFAGGTVSASGSAVASVIGTAENSSISGVYYDKSISNLPYGIGIGSDSTTPISGSDELHAAASYPSLSFGNVWTIIEGKTSPMLISQNGEGTQAQPYKIHSQDDYLTIFSDDSYEGKYYKLEADLYLPSQLGTQDKPFNGHFDGGNHWILNSNKSVFKVIGEKGSAENIMRYQSPKGSVNVAGIAEINYGTIKNSCVYATIGNATKDAGGIAGENIGGTISGCYFSGVVNVYESGAGGIAGYNSYGTIENCGVNMRSSGGQRAIGGITGDNSFGTIKNCYAKTNITSGSEIGGISGRLYNGSVISSYTDCYVNGKGSIGGIFGAQIEDAYVENSYYMFDANKPETLDTEQQKYERAGAEMKKQSTFTGFDFNGVWSIDEGVDTPRLKAIDGSGTKANPYKIKSEEDINNIKKNRRVYYELTNDIPSAAGYSEVGGDFIGSLNGNGYTITMTADNPLFTGLGKGAYVGNVHIIGENLADNAEGATIEYTTVSSNGTYTPDVFVESANDCTIRNCRVSGASVSGNAAGAFANNITGGTVTDSAATDSSVKGSNIAGGFVGMTSGASISGCLAYNVRVEGATAGGFVGRNDNGSSISNSAAQGTVNGSSYAGSFAGMNYATITSSYGLAKTTDGSTLPSAGYDSGTSGGVVTSSDSDTYKIISTGGIATGVDVPTLAADEKTALSTVTLSDISGHWAEATIKKLVGKGVINGYEDGTYRPQNSVTKGEFITLLLAAENVYLQDGFTGYEDVNKHWAKNQVYTAIQFHLTDNINESAASFGVDKAITRAEAVAMMGRLIAAGESGTLNFTDNNDIPDWAKNEVGACVSKGIINGMDDGSFAPNKSLTRAESAIIIDKLMELK